LITLTDERAEHAAAVEALLDRAYGEARWHKTSHKLRDGDTPLRGISLVALEHDALIGTVRLWPVLAGRRRTLLLGPLAVDPAWQHQGIGASLVEEALRRAAASNEGSVLLVGDEPYYKRFGFKPGLTCGLILPGPVDRKRFLAREIKPGALDGARGPVAKIAA
jgi:predicted N-acetyltransferase YhbS